MLSIFPVSRLIRGFHTAFGDRPIASLQSIGRFQRKSLQSMQSVLQYRRFEKHLREQIHRHGLDRTSGVRGSILGQVKPHPTPAAEPKDVEAGPAPLVAGRDHTLEEKETLDQDPIPPRQDAPVFGNAADGEDNLSGSTTRSLSTSTADSLRPDLRTASTQDTTGESPYNV